MPIHSVSLSVTIWLLIFFFFFSSRRRHTRLQGDWSSDVCSSDLSYFKPVIFNRHSWLIRLASAVIALRHRILRQGTTAHVGSSHWVQRRERQQWGRKQSRAMPDTNGCYQPEAAAQKFAVACCSWPTAAST